MFRRIVVSIAALAFPVLSATAIPFDSTTVGGTATVGTGGDYASLKAAADAFNAVTSPFIQGNWKLEILNNLTEPVNVSFGNTIPAGSSLTLKPAAGTTPIINFSQLVDNGGPSGNLLIGTANPNVWTTVSTSNFIIDGSNNGSTSRDLTIKNDPAITHTFSCPLAIVGNTDGTIIKNCKVLNDTGTTGTSAAALSAVMRDTLVPDNFQIVNCLVESPQTQGHGILLRASGTPVAGTAMTGWIIEKCEIKGRIRSIFLDAGIDGTVRNNLIFNGTVGSAVNGYHQVGVGVNNARTQTGKTLHVLSNLIFIKSANSTDGNYGVSSVSVATGGSGNTVNVINNMMNFQFTNSSATASKMVYNAMRFSSQLTYNVFHNSINMPNFTNLTALAPGNGLAVADASAIRFPSGVGYTANVKNNIFRIQQKGLTTINIAKTAGTPVLDFDNNDYVVAPTAFHGTTGGSTAVNAVTLDDWKTASGEEPNAFSVDPTATTGAKWEVAATTADLHFMPATSRPVELPGVPALASVTTDIDGETRNATAAGTYPGADDGTVALPVSLSGFEIE